MKIKCPICGKKLEQLNVDTRGPIYNFYYEYWCDVCKLDISIGTDRNDYEEEE